MPKEVQDLLITHFTFNTIEAYKLLYKEDESTSDFMFIVLEGSFQVLKNQLEGEKLVAPQIVGESALLHSAFRRHSIYTLE